MQTKSLNVAVLAVLAALINNDETFSAYDVTQKVRDQVNAGEYGITGEVPQPLANGNVGYNIEHEKVRDFVGELYRSDLLKGYVQDFARGPRGSYKVFRPDTNGTTVLSGQLADPSLGLLPSTPLVALTFPSASPVAKTGIDTLGDALLSYVKTRVAAGNPPTLKEIQSRFKGQSYTCSEYANLAASLGLTVSAPGNLNQFSLSTVA